jgi:hypothetical protein
MNKSTVPLMYGYLRNKSWKPECVGSFNMGWRILVFYPDPESTKRKKEAMLELQLYHVRPPHKRHYPFTPTDPSLVH